MFPSEINGLPCGVGLVVGETVLGLYVGSVEAVTEELGSVGPPEDDNSVRDETAELSAREEQAVVSNAHRIAITAATRRRWHMWARRTVGGTGDVRAGLVLPVGCAGT